MNGYIEAVGVLAAIIDLGMSVPQTIRLYRSKRVDGVSTLTWIVLYATFSGWCLYGYVNGSIELWCQDNAYGKRINATLRGVQFLKDGEAFAGGGSASADEFDDLGVDDEEEALV